MTQDDAAPPRWTVLALGLLLAIALNPGFDPRYHLSAYSETSVTVALLFAGWHAARALDRLSGRRDARDDLLMLALILAVLVNIKQESVALAFGVVVTGDRGRADGARTAGKAIAQLLLAAVPALMLYLGWRWYVLDHFALGELKGLPFAQWHIRELPAILLNILRAIGERGVFFAILFIALAIAAGWRLLRRELDLGTRVAALLLGVALIYNLALLGAYVAHFEGRDGHRGAFLFPLQHASRPAADGNAACSLRATGAGNNSAEAGGAPCRPSSCCSRSSCRCPSCRMLRFDLEVPESAPPIASRMRRRCALR